MSKETWKPDVFETLFQKSHDPWDFENSLYEQKKLARILECLPACPVSFALELGCAIGVSTLALAQYCKRVVSVDASETALHTARKRCEGLGHVTFIKAFLPEDYPVLAASGCDLVLISEILYFLSASDIQRLAVRVTQSLTEAGCILIVNWTGPTDTPCTGDEASECFIQACRDLQWEPDLSVRESSYRIDRLSYVPNSQEGESEPDAES
ncbi:methyltransferase type 12 [Acetobacter malorum]|uniref:Methyltransferase type 12 n=1 Tax=Acetobacter malorum TaxID=178901 RepID=A0A177G4P7_9PROT|nr:class I SAM-dependent methyltransferase [Acetobacter malorum]OAG75328.1 methyltransferase type 12 [Acetobacter malorum]